MQMSEIRGRLKAVHANAQDLADFMKVPYHVASRIVRGERKTLTTVEHDEIVRFFALREKAVSEPPAVGDTAEDVLNGLGERPPEFAGRRGEVPLFGGLDTRDGVVLSLAEAARVGRVMPHPLQATAKRPFAVEVIDETMSPRFEMGEIAYVSGGQMPRKGQDCLVEFSDSTARILQFVERTERQVIFRQLNPPRQIIRQIGEKLSIHAIVGRG